MNRGRLRLTVFTPTLALLVALACAHAPSEPLDLVIEGGRVIDPESGLDALRNVGLRNGRIVAVTKAPLGGAEVIDARGLVVAPGFIDTHHHNAAIRTIAAREAVPIVDLEALFKARSDFRNLFYDTMHPTDEGYALVAEEVLRILDQTQMLNP